MLDDRELQRSSWWQIGMSTRSVVANFAEYFKLKNPHRTSFMLNPDLESDIEIFVDLDQIRNRFDRFLVDPGRLVIEGDFGSGKSHLLRYLERHLREQHDSEKKLQPFYLKLSGIEKRVDFIVLYRQIMDVLFKLVDQDCRQPLRMWPKEKLEKIPMDSDLYHALFACFKGSLADTPEKRLAERWIRADKDLRSAETVKNGYLSRLVNKSPVQLVGIILSLAQLYNEVTERKLLMLLDESETFSRVTDEPSQANIASGLREFFDPTNQVLGIVVGLNTPSTRVGHHPMLRNEVRSRMLGKYFSLKPLDTPDRILDFVRNLWTQLTREPEEQPFMLSADSLALFASQLAVWRVALDPTLNADMRIVPRDVYNMLDFIGQEAVSRHVQPPIKKQSLKDWFGDS